MPTHPGMPFFCSQVSAHQQEKLRTALSCWDGPAASTTRGVPAQTNHPRQSLPERIFRQPKARALGHEARIIQAIYVTPFVKGQKNGYHDAEAVAKLRCGQIYALSRTKTQDQPDLQAPRSQSGRRFREANIGKSNSRDG